VRSTRGAHRERNNEWLEPSDTAGDRSCSTVQDYPGGVEAVKGIDFEVAAGEIFGLLGPNGAGKSTTIGMLTTTVEPTSGTARLVGFDVRDEPLAARRGSAVVFQEAVVDRSLTGRRNLEIHSRLGVSTRGASAARVAEIALAFGLTDLIDRPLASYSGGERRRLEIARALMSHPESAVPRRAHCWPRPSDPPRAPRRDRHLARRRGGDGPAHQPITWMRRERLCDRVAIVHAGRVVALGKPAELLAGFGRELLELRVPDDTTVAMAIAPRERRRRPRRFPVGSTLTVPLHDRSARESMDAIETAGVAVDTITARTPTLDDVYLQLTGTSLAA